MRPYEGITVDNFQYWVETGWTRKAESAAETERELAIMSLGLCGESGEVVEHIKKQLRGDGPVDRSALKLELGDVLHYLARIASHYFTMQDIMEANIEKIEARRGKRKWETA